MKREGDITNYEEKREGRLPVKSYDILIIGGGPSGLAAAISAREQGIESVLILERDRELGGILNQCIHNGFGLHTFKEELTGPEYAGRYIDRAKELKIECKLNAMVIDITPEKRVTAVSRREGLFELHAEAIILAMGCRERPRGVLNIPGYRPAGIFSAGMAQRLVNMEGFLPGREIVILGSGDIGLIIARRMTLEGAHVKLVAELMSYSGGLKRNIVQCLDDYDIPLRLNHTVVDIHGKERLIGIILAQVDDKGKPIPGTEEEYACDTLLLSVGLIPENELSFAMGVDLHPVTAGPRVNESLETSIEGVFACGNVLHVHDLVDFVSQEAELAGKNAADYIKKNVKNKEAAVNAAEEITADGSEKKLMEEEVENSKIIRLFPEAGVRYTVPETIRPAYMPETVTICFRSDHVYKSCCICVYFEEEQILRRKRQIVTPGEMEQVILTREQILKYPDVKAIHIRIEEVQP